MKHLLIAFILHGVVSCTPTEHRKEVKRIFSGVITCESNLLIHRDSIEIIEKFLNRESNELNNIIFRNLSLQKDTLKSQRIYGFSNRNDFRQLIDRKGSLLSLNNICQYDFHYDKIPSLLAKKFNQDEQIISFKKANRLWIYITRHNRTSEWTLYLSDELNKNVEKKSLSVKLENRNFLIQDFIKDKTPEIFVFRKYYFMGNDLSELEVFSISNH
jgi:hypothetical protein